MSVLMLNAIMSILARVMEERLPTLVNQSFVDDITLLAETEENLQEAFNIVDPFLRLTDQKLNVTKTHTFGINTNQVNIKYRGDSIAPKELLKILGLKFRFANGTVSYRYLPEDISYIEPTCSRIRSSGLPFWGRALVAGGALVNKVAYASEVRQLTGEQERKIKNNVLAAVWSGSSGSRKRTPGIAYTLFMKGHVADVTQATLISRWMCYLRAVRNNPELATLIWNSRRHDCFRVQGRGPAEALHAASRRLNIEWFGNTLVEINGYTFNLLNCNSYHFAHELREQGRKMIWSQTRSDMRRYIRNPGDQLPHLVDVGLSGGVDRKATMTLYNCLTNQRDKGILRTIISNGVWTAKIRKLLPQNSVESDVCPYCESGQVEDLHHLWWSCPAWSTTRRATFNDYPNDVDAMGFNNWAQCTITCGIKNKADNVPEGVITDVQMMMLAVFKERETRKREQALLGLL